MSIFCLFPHAQVRPVHVTTAGPATIQGSAKRQSPGLVNFVAALAYHIYLNLPAPFTQPGDHFLADPCTCVAMTFDGSFAESADPLFPFYFSAYRNRKHLHLANSVAAGVVILDQLK